MSTQINQWLMWGISMPYKWHKEWEEKNGKEFYETFEFFMDDSAFNAEVNHKDGIFCLFDGCNGDFIIIGRALAKARDGDYLASDGPMKITELSNLEKEFIRISVERNFGVTGEFAHYFVTQYR